MAEAIRDLRPNTNVDTVPREVFDIVRAQMRDSSVTYRAMDEALGRAHGGSQRYSFSPSRDLLQDYAEVLASQELRAIATSDIFWDRVVEVRPCGHERVFDISVPGPNTWIANGSIVSHNCGALEQDGKLILGLRYPYYYDRDETLKNTLEVHCLKNHNGEAGRCIILFWDVKSNAVYDNELSYQHARALRRRNR